MSASKYRQSHDLGVLGQGDVPMGLLPCRRYPTVSTGSPKTWWSFRRFQRDHGQGRTLAHTRPSGGTAQRVARSYCEFRYRSATAECQILEDLVLTPVVTERAVRVERQLLLRQGPLLRDRLCCPRTTSASPRPPHRHKPRAATPSTMAWFSTESGQANISIKPSLWPSVLGAVRPTRAPSGSR